MPPTSDLLIESEIISVRRTEQVNQKLDLHVQNRRKNTLSKKRLNQQNRIPCMAVSCV
jgi:hypothetical protein